MTVFREQAVIIVRQISECMRMCVYILACVLEEKKMKGGGGGIVMHQFAVLLVECLELQQSCMSRVNLSESGWWKAVIGRVQFKARNFCV